MEGEWDIVSLTATVDRNSDYIKIEYDWDNSNGTTTTGVSSCTDNTFTCDSSHSGQTYTSCKKNYVCTSGTTKLNDSYCYKIN